MVSNGLFRVCVAGVVLATFGAACGASFTTRDPIERQSGDSPLTGVSRQAQLPPGTVDIVGEWEAGDAAFRSGDPESAQVHFGTVYLADPAFGDGQVVAALNESCRVIQNDCALVMGRLDTLRIVYTEQHGPRNSWVEQQGTDYDSIMSCYDNALAGNFDEAYGAGYGVVNAPLPAFSALARVCLDRVQLIRSQIAIHEQWLEAVDDWDATYPGFSENATALHEALPTDDWDAIVDVYPRYKIAEETIGGIVASGLLAEDPQRGADVAATAEGLQVVHTWESTNLESYDQMRDAINALEDNSEYNQALIEYERLYAPIPGLRDEIATLELAAEATTGSERRSVTARVDAKESEIRDINRSLRRIMVTINEIREGAGLPAREAPYGLE